MSSVPGHVNYPYFKSTYGQEFCNLLSYETDNFSSITTLKWVNSAQVSFFCFHYVFLQ